MAKPFQARKTRERAKKPTIKIGKALIPSLALELEYYREIYNAVYEAVVGETLPFKPEGYAEDRLTVNSLKALQRKAYALVARAVTKINRHSAKSTWASIEELAKDNLTVGKVSMEPLLQQQIETNVGLITNLGEEARAKLTALYKEHGPDQATIYKELKHMVGYRSKLIAKDQNAKIFTSLNTSRMLESGLKTFIWDHSSAGKTPRPCHVKRDGHTFLLTGGPAELHFEDGSDANYAFGGKKGDEGKPGYAINCRCRMRPTSSLDD